MKKRKEDGQIYLSFGYNLAFSNKLKRYCGAKWNPETKEWYFDEEFEEKSNDLMLNAFGFSFRSNERILVKFNAGDFVVDRGNTTTVGVNKVDFVWREARDRDVTLANDVIILDGEFPKRGGSARYPSVWINKEDGIVLRVKLYKEFYDTLSEEDKAKMEVIRETDRKETLLTKREELLQELEDIEKELAKCEN